MEGFPNFVRERSAGVLSSADRAALFGVVDACSRSNAPFAETLLDALASKLNYRSATCFVGNDIGGIIATGEISTSGHARSMLEPYLARYRAIDVFHSPEARFVLMQQGVADTRDLPSGTVDRHRRYFDEFLVRNGVQALLAACVDASPSGVAIIGILDCKGDLDAVDLWRLMALRTVLAAWFERDRRRVTRARLQELTVRETQVAELVATGLTNAAIAASLNVQVDTVKKHLSVVFQVIGVRNRTELALRLR